MRRESRVSNSPRRAESSSLHWPSRRMRSPRTCRWRRAGRQNLLRPHRSPPWSSNRWTEKLRLRGYGWRQQEVEAGRSAWDGAAPHAPGAPSPPSFVTGVQGTGRAPSTGTRHNVKHPPAGSPGSEVYCSSAWHGSALLQGSASVGANDRSRGLRQRSCYNGRFACRSRHSR